MIAWTWAILSVLPWPAGKQFAVTFLGLRACSQWRLSCQLGDRLMVQATTNGMLLGMLHLVHFTFHLAVQTAKDVTSITTLLLLTPDDWSPKR